MCPRHVHAIAAAARAPPLDFVHADVVPTVGDGAHSELWLQRGLLTCCGPALLGICSTCDALGYAGGRLQCSMQLAPSTSPGLPI